jgi:hypothetical protein
MNDERTETRSGLFEWEEAETSAMDARVEELRRAEQEVNAMGKIICIVLGICGGLLLVVMLIGIGIVFERHTFRASVSGRITDTQGNPIVGAKVEYRLFNAPGETVQFDMSTRTDAEGRYSTRLPSFTVALDTSPDYLRQVLVTADGYAQLSTSRELKKGSNPEGNYTLEIERTAAEQSRQPADDAAD